MRSRVLEHGAVRDLLLSWQGGRSLRAIARETGIDRKTVRRYVTLAEASRIGSGPVDDVVRAMMYVVCRGSRVVSAAQHALAWSRSRIREWLAGRMPLATIHAKLVERGVRVSYSTLRRFAIRECGWGRRLRTVTRQAAGF